MPLSAHLNPSQRKPLSDTHWGVPATAPTLSRRFIRQIASSTLLEDASSHHPSRLKSCQRSGQRTRPHTHNFLSALSQRVPNALPLDIPRPNPEDTRSQHAQLATMCGMLYPSHNQAPAGSTLSPRFNVSLDGTVPSSLSPTTTGRHTPSPGRPPSCAGRARARPATTAPGLLALARRRPQHHQGKKAPRRHLQARLTLAHSSSQRQRRSPTRQLASSTRLDRPVPTASRSMTQVCHCLGEHFLARAQPPQLVPNAGSLDTSRLTSDDARLLLDSSAARHTMCWRSPPRAKITACCFYCAEGFSQRTAADQHANKQSAKRSSIAACILSWRTNDATAGLTNR